MQAVVFTKYGSPDVLRLTEIDRPTPKDDEVLVKVHAVSLNDWDIGALGGDAVNRVIFGLRRPKMQILGSDIAGRIEAVGKSVMQFKPGDEVFGDLSGRWGGFAEYVCAPEKALVLKSPGMTFEQAAAIPQAGLLALQGLRDAGRIQSGQKLLINGAGGGVGTFAIQIAKLQDVEVTAVDSAEKLDMLRSLGADHVIDYRQEDFTRNGKRYDLVLDVKTNRSIFDCMRALNKNGVYVILGGSFARLIPTLLLGSLFSMIRNKRVRILPLKTNKGLTEMRDLFEAGKLLPVIDGPYDLSEVPQAFRYFMEGRHKGKVVITVDRCHTPGDCRVESAPA